MTKHRHFLVLLILLAVSKDFETKKTQNKPSIHIFPGRLRLLVDYYKECEDVSGVAMRTNNTHIRTTGKNLVVIDADYYVQRVIPTITKTVISIFNCPDRASGDCALFQTWRWGRDACQMIAQKNQMWSPFYESIKPPFRCPNLPPGKMELRNGTLDMRATEAIPFPWEKYYWRIRQEFFDPSLFQCITAGAQFLRSRTQFL